MAFSIIDISNYQKTHWVYQKELSELAKRLNGGEDAEMLMESLFERFQAGAVVERGPRSMAIEILSNGDRIVSVSEAGLFRKRNNG